ncbi:MAG: CoA pyrophosphatase [Corynebacterium sp.]|uniref:NUDIX hydrolase n=1 Tax=Corynebacterium sp. TaxID=1720 RepID=UPI0026DCADD1|nr:CoA pyrophosphatase [Corynebacterium sp.]MDO5099092.1 CoA pyrophosphatase [Corynebacterium sp.]
MNNHTDTPGQNTKLQPDQHPQWLGPLIEEIHLGNVSQTLEHSLEPIVPIDRSKQSAVLILLQGDDSTTALPKDASILLTHRSPHLRAHSGQIAFPGGRIDPTDHNPIDAALREAWEETGLDRATVTPLAQLPEVHIRVTGNPVHPIVAHRRNDDGVGVVNPVEADAVFSVPIEELAAPENRLVVSKGAWRGPAFRIHDYIIWGFTGGMLNALLAHAGWDVPWDEDTYYDLAEMIAASRNNERHF